jgi:DNA invertase Pin-like site-specific DNA recombinase
MTGDVPATKAPMRTVLYARYSSDLQRDASIEDQLRVCGSLAEREGWEVRYTFTDSATSGATTLRAGYQAMLAAIRKGDIDIVVAESLDRFSRDLEHIASFHKQCVFNHVRIHTLAEGKVSELHIGLKGTMGALYLKDLADKTRRGLEGRIQAGRCTGSPPYGYTVVRQLAANGELDRGLREIDPTRAAVVRRVFELYAGGASPRRIAQTLNAEGVPAPGGGSWFSSSILGRAKRGDGLLRNELYAGRLVWRRRVNAKDPMSGATVRRQGRLEDRVVKVLADMRIVDDELWDRVQERMNDEAAVVRFGGKRGQHAFWDRRRPRHLLTGKVVCGACGRAFKMSGKDYLRCRAATDGACTNRRTVRLGILQHHVLDLLQRQLMQPALVAEFIKTFNAELHRLTGELRAQAASAQRERAVLDRKIANLIDAISEGRASPAIMAKLEELEVQRANLADTSPLPAAPVVALHPGIADVYAAKVATLASLLADGHHPEALEAARALIDKVIIHPPESDDDPPGVELVGDLVALLRAAGVEQANAGDEPSGADPVLGLFISSIKAGPGAEPLALPTYYAATPANSATG